MPFDVRNYNRNAWDHQVDTGNEWTVPVSSSEVEAARRGEWAIVLTPVKPVPKEWFPRSLAGVKVLCLASGGGQQAPILAAAGAHVTLVDNSPKQLEQDRLVAERDGLEIALVEGDMRDLSGLEDGSFDLIVHPCSNCFVPNVEPVWQESYRVLGSGGSILSGFLQPAVFLFDADKYDRGELEVRHRLPYSDVTSIGDEERSKVTAKGEPLCFSHTLDALIGGQIAAGFALTGFYEDVFAPSSGDVLSKHMSTFIATRAIKR